MFTMTREWLHEYYGSHSPSQVRDAKKWLHRYGHNVPAEQVDEWAQWKHLTEYQVNTNDIVPRCLSQVGQQFESELAAHCFVNKLRVPVAAAEYEKALSVARPRTILELGVGGDSGISTSVFLYWLENNKDTPKATPKRLLSVDINSLGATKRRFEKCTCWEFRQSDSVLLLRELVGQRFDMIFIDTIHSYPHTLAELQLAQHMTDWLLMDDCHFLGNDFDPAPGGVDRAIKEFLVAAPEWSQHPVVKHENNVMLLRRKAKSR